MAKFRIKTTAQVERVYVIEAADEGQAKKRMTAFKHDPDVFAPGIVEEQKEEQKDTSLQQIKEVAALPPEKPVAAPKATTAPKAAAAKPTEAPKAAA